mmetsp:Transcript_42148/g.78367  ORF Transcript_42148/g.78367 Transcript_42148/m.78367 type:complete len:103 (+) Transcript_42148:1723-2031(+)
MRYGHACTRFFFKINEAVKAKEALLPLLCYIFMNEFQKNENSVEYDTFEKLFTGKLEAEEHRAFVEAEIQRRVNAEVQRRVNEEIQRRGAGQSSFLTTDTEL